MFFLQDSNGFGRWQVKKKTFSYRRSVVAIPHFSDTAIVTGTTHRVVKRRKHALGTQRSVTCSKSRLFDILRPFVF